MAPYRRPHKVDFAAPHSQTTRMIVFPSISPEIFSVTLFGMTFALRWYAMAYIVGILFGWWIILRAIRTPGLWAGGPPLTAEQVERFFTWIGRNRHLTKNFDATIASIISLLRRIASSA